MEQIEYREREIINKLSELYGKLNRLSSKTL